MGIYMCTVQSYCGFVFLFWGLFVCFFPPSMGAFIVKQILWEQNSIWFFGILLGCTDDFWNIFISGLCLSMFSFRTMQDFSVDVMPFVDQSVWLDGEAKHKTHKLLFKTFGFERPYAQYLSVYIYYL